jgi:integrase
VAINQVKEGRNQGRWIIDWRDEYGKRHWQILGYNKRQAYEVLSKQITARAEKRSLDLKKGDEHTFYYLCDHYIEKYAKEKKASWQTDASKVKKFKIFFGNVRLSQIPRERIDEYALARKKSGVQGGTINKEVTILKRIFEHALDNEWLEKNPARKWAEYPENPVCERYVLHGEYQELRNAVERLLLVSGKGWRRRLHLNHFRYILALGFDTGGRRSEIVGLKWEDVNFAERLVRYWYRKGRKRELKSRWVSMTGEVFNLLLSLPRNQDCPYLFPDEQGGLWKSKISFYRLWKRICEEAKILDIDFHTLRHSYATHSALNGVGEKTRMDLMGHTSPVTQMRYTHISEQVKRDAAAALDRARQKAENVGCSMDVPDAGIQDENSKTT